MPTLRTRTVGPGKDYATLAAWEAGEQADLVALDEIREAELYSMTDTTQVDFDGWTTDATRFIRIKVAAGERHAGIWDAAKYVHSVTDTNNVFIREDYIEFDGLQFTIASPSAARDFIGNVGRTAGRIMFSNCIFKGHGNATYQLQFYGEVSGNFATVYLINCLIYNWGANASSYFITSSANTIIHAYNSTFIWPSGVSAGVREDSGTLTCYNCYSGGSGSNSFFGTPLGDFNASEDTTADTIFSTGRNSIPVNTTTFTNVTASSEDFRLPLGSGLIGMGTDGPFSAPADYTTDVQGETRASTWDIGFDEYVVAAPTSNPARIIFQKA
jgi:hypothetical protein